MVQRTRIVSPVDGYVTNLLSRLGDYLNVGVNAVSVVDANSFWVDGYFEETNLAPIRIGDQARIKLIGYSQIVRGHVDSITGGASRAGISLPSASARMKGMEEMLGTALLERHRRGVHPTPAGQALFHHSQLVLAQMERLRGDLREHARGGMRGHIRLISNTTALEEYLPDVLAGWLASNPGVDIALEERLSYEIAPAVAQGHADIGVLVLADLTGVEGLETYPFRIDRLVVVVPRGHALAGRRNIAFVDVLDEEFVGLVAGSALAEHLAWQSARLGRSLKPRIQLRGLDAVCRLVGSSVGIAVVPETAAKRCRRTMAFSTLRLTDAWAERQLTVCVRRLEALPAHARRLVQHLTETTRTDA